MSEYQASKNKAHDHAGGQLTADGAFTTLIYKTYDGSGIISKASQYIAAAINTTGSDYGSGTWSFNFAGKWYNKTASEGSVSKPPTVAFMWICRYI